MKFRFSDFNYVRYARGADAARVEVTEDDGTGHLLWMSTQDIKKNVMLFGPHLGLLQAANSYNLNVRALVASWRAGGDKKFLNPMDPARPRDGWFIVSIHDHEDGPVCVWARDKGQS